ncbi:hypothetical protein ACH9EU_16160 [Kocuria sp. M1R5S2]|uniref:hypothetical protein n=1 Tax=Kocuria rhizosphaerae TaxID=3376285 RepID=UPI0037ADA0A5
MIPHPVRILAAVVPGLALAAALVPALPAAADAPAAGPAILAQQGSARVSGEIFGHHGSGWTVELIRPGETGPARSVSTGDGRTFEFTGVQPGEYLVQARHPASGTTGPATPVTLRPGDNGAMTLVFDGPPPGQGPGMLAPLTGRVEGAAPDASSVVVEVLSDRDGELVGISSAPVAEDGTFSVDPQVVEGHALPIHLRAVQVLPGGATEAVYHGQSPTVAEATPIVAAEGVADSYELSFTEAYGRPAPTDPPGPATEEPRAAAEQPAAAPQDAGGTGPPPAVWAALAVAAVAVAAAVAVVVRRRAG